jgi:hypothetical protein
LPAAGSALIWIARKLEKPSPLGVGRGPPPAGGHPLPPVPPDPDFSFVRRSGLPCRYNAGNGKEDAMNDSDAPADPQKDPQTEIETDYEEVFETAEPDVLPVIKSLLDGAGIPWATHGEGMMNIFPSEVMTLVTLTDQDEVRIYVPESRAEEARALLSGDFTLTDPPPELANIDTPIEET